MAPFNRIVVWTWPLLGLATVLYSLGSTAHSSAAENVLKTSSYALASSIFASNICAAALYANGDPQSFALCDVVGVGTGAAVEGARIYYTFTEQEWEYVRGLPEDTVNGVGSTFAQSVRRAEDSCLRAMRAVGLSEIVRAEDFTEENAATST